MTSDNRVETSKRELTEAEREEFLLDNYFGFLGFVGDKPYVIPVAYLYRKGTFLLALQGPGRKMDYVKKNPRICFTISRPIVLTGFKEPCTGVIVEGELEEVPDRAYYGMDKEIPEMPENLSLFRIKVDKIGSKKCTSKPCPVFSGEIIKNWVSIEAFSRQMHGGKLAPQ